MCEIDSSWGRWSLTASFWDLGLNPPPDSWRREGEDKAFSLGTEGRGRCRGRGRWVHWQQLCICGDLGDDFISNGRLSSNGHPALRKNTLSSAVSSSLLMCCVCETNWWSFPSVQTIGAQPLLIHIYTYMLTLIYTRHKSVNRNTI